MRTSMRRWLCTAVAAGAITLLADGCVVYAHPAPPPAPVEEETPPPHKKAKWVPGHYKWVKTKQSYVWVSGYWK